MKGRKGGDSEDGDPLRQILQPRRRSADSFQKSLQQGRVVGMFISLDQLAPQNRLPVLRVRALFFLPVEDHSRAEGEILVEEIGDPERKLEELEAGPVFFEIKLEVRKRPLFQAGGKKLHDLPGHDGGVKGGIFRDVRDDLLENLEDETIGKGKSVVGANPVVAGQLHGNPALHAFALHQDDFFLHRRGQRFPEQAGEFFGQDFQAVAGIEL